mgnify:CR=1 FL=1
MASKNLEVKVGNEAYLKFIGDCVKEPNAVFPPYVKASTPENDTFHADMDCMKYPPCSDIIPLPRHLVADDSPMDNVSLYLSNQEFSVISSWSAFAIDTPILALLLTGNPSMFLEARQHALISAYQRDFKPDAEETPFTKNIGYRHALARMKLRKIKKHLAAFQVKSWSAVQSTADIGHFYNCIMDMVIANDCFVSGFTVSREAARALLTHANAVYEADMKAVAERQKQHQLEFPEGPSEAYSRLVVFEVLLAKERWILTVANIPKSAHYIFFINPNTEDPIPPPELRERMEMQNRELLLIRKGEEMPKLNSL